MLLFKQMNLNSNESVCKKLQPGDTIDLQYKLSLNRDQEFVIYDKQMALDMMFVVYSNFVQEPATLDKVRDEMHALGSSHAQWQMLETLFEQSESENECLKAAVKTYTSEAVFRQIGSAIVNGNYQQVSNYIELIIDKVGKFGD